MRWLLTLFGLIASFFVAELVVRAGAPQPTGPQLFAFDPVRGEIPTPGKSGVRQMPGIYRYSYANNSLGLRGEREYGPPAKPRLLLLGDSFVYGIGVDDGETAASVMERALGGSVEVVNAGNPDKGTDYALRFWNTIGRDLRPEAVWIFLFKNDPTDNAREIYYAVRDGEIVEQKPRAVIPLRRVLSGNRLYDYVLERSHFFNLLKRASLAALTRNAPPAPVVCPEPGRDRPRERATAVLLAELARTIRASGAEARFFYVPDENDAAFFEEHRRPSDCEEQIRTMFATLDLPFFSLTPPLAEREGPVADLYYAEGHWTSAGNALVGETLADLFRRRK